MQEIMNYVKPELMILTVVLYFIGKNIKTAHQIKNKYIPGILGVLGILFSGIYVIGTTKGFSSVQEICTGIFTAVVQGVLVAGFSTYVDQLIKQKKKAE